MGETEMLLPVCRSGDRSDNLLFYLSISYPRGLIKLHGLTVHEQISRYARGSADCGGGTFRLYRKDSVFSGWPRN